MNSTRKTLSAFFMAACSVAVVLTTSYSVFAQGPVGCGGQGNPAKVTNTGTDFLLVYMQNESSEFPTTNDPSTNNQDIYVASIGDTATVHIWCKATGYDTTVFLKANQGDAIWINQNPKYQCNNYTTETASDMDVLVHSSNDIVCYGMSREYLTADGFLALPKNVAGTYYYVLSYPNSSGQLFNASEKQPSEFAVGTWDDNTTVTFTPTYNTSTGSRAGQPHTITLNAGQCFQVQSEYLTNTEADLTGTTISSNNPVVVYGGHSRTEVPHDFTYATSNISGSRDHLSEQIPPVSTWGKAFITRNFQLAVAGDMMRVLSSADNDTVKINGVVWGAPLAAGKYRDTLIAFNSVLDSEGIFAVETSQPSLVGMYMHTAEVSPGPGDPFLAIMSPVDQFFTNYTYYLSPRFTGGTDVIIVTEASGIGGITVDGVPYPASSFEMAKVPVTSSLGKKNYAVTVTQQSNGFHHIATTNPQQNGISILAYGYNNQESYGYTAGALFKPIHGIWRMPDPSALPAPGSPIAPSFTIRNILGEEPVLLDSIRITYTSNEDNIEVNAGSTPMTYFGTMYPADEKKITLMPKTVPTHDITGTARIYYHSGLWFDMLPLEIDFTVAAGTLSSVAGTTNGSVAATLYPNPASTGATLEFTLPAQAHVQIAVYDALGREVTKAVDATMAAGANYQFIPTERLTNGTYYYELSAPSLGISDRGMLVVQH